ncbi:MAG TPA: DUF2269 family protein [Candidatus Baltobacteraceae bacterium]|nr:DUF2269 family protein [Candidatus Baltobacteraceae bacterium]
MYHFIVYLHLVALILAFFATGLVVAGALALRRADRVDDARFALGLAALAAKFHPIAALGLLATGAYLTQTAWSWNTPWILCGVIGLVIVAIMGAGVLGSRERAMLNMLRDTPDGPILAPLRERLDDPVSDVGGPAISIFVLGIAFLMVMKPDLLGSILTLAIAALLGIGAGMGARAGASKSARAAYAGAAEG